MSNSSSPSLLSRRSSGSPGPPGPLPANMSIDLSNIPPIAQPTPPTNTLLITNLQDTDIFRAENLQTVRSLIEQTAPIHTWAPLKCFRRIVVSFIDEDLAIRVRAVWDGESIMGHRTRVYFGQHTPIQPRQEHLALPDAGKLFFISPPPSPPHGWEMKLEGAPNKMVHADDLADALAQLRCKQDPAAGMDHSPISPAESGPSRSRSSTLIYHPKEHGIGSDMALPVISVEDMTMESTDSFMTNPIMEHTTRPPVELMHYA